MVDMTAVVRAKVEPATPASPARPAPGFEALAQTDDGILGPSLKRQRSLPTFRPHVDPPPYPTFARGGPLPAPREDEGSERLPGYRNDIYLASVLPRTMEFTAPGVQAKDRKWRRVLCVLEGTAFKVYALPIGKGGGSVLGGLWEKAVGAGDIVESPTRASEVAALTARKRRERELEREREREALANKPRRDLQSTTPLELVRPFRARVHQATSRLEGGAQADSWVVASCVAIAVLRAVERTSQARTLQIVLARVWTSWVDGVVAQICGDSVSARARPRVPGRASQIRGPVQLEARVQTALVGYSPHLHPLPLLAPTPASRRAAPAAASTASRTSVGAPVRSPHLPRHQPSHPVPRQTRPDLFHEPAPAKDVPRLEEGTLIREYSLQNAESGLASDYVKRRNVIRLRMEGEQFLVQASDVGSVVDWNEGFQAAANISLDLDERPMPRGPLFPR